MKPGHLFGSTEMMTAAEVLSAIVEQACLYESESAVGETFKSSKAHFRSVKALNEEKVSKEVLTDSEKVSPNEALSVVKVPDAASNLVSFK